MKTFQRIKEIILSVRTVQRRIANMTKNIDAQVKNYLLSSDVISIALDESTDVNIMIGLAIIIRFASINEELYALASINYTTKGSNIFRHVQELTEINIENVLDLRSKLFSITNIGTPSTIGKHVGFVKLM